MADWTCNQRISLYGRAWNERWWYSTGTSLEALNALTVLSIKRKDLLGLGATITNLQVSDLAVAGDSRSVGVSFSTDVFPNVNADRSWTGAKISVEAGGASKCTRNLRGIPDLVSQPNRRKKPGTNSAAWQKAWVAWRDTLVRTSWRYRLYTVDPLFPASLVNGVAPGGGGRVRITTVLPHGLATNDYVVLRGISSAPKVSGEFRILKDGDSSFELFGTNLCKLTYSGGGTATKRAFALSEITGIEQLGIGHRETGVGPLRPSGRTKRTRRIGI